MIWLLSTVWVRGNTTPLHDLPYSCIDPRYPVFIQEWVVSCAANNKIGRALSLQTGEVVQFSATEMQVGFGDDIFLGKAGSYDFAQKKVLKKARIVSDLIAPPTAFKETVAYLGEEFVAFRVGRQSFTHKTSPDGWYPPAISNDWVGWVENEHIHAWHSSSAEPAIQLGKGRHIKGTEKGFFWYTDTAIKFWNPTTLEQWSIPARVVDRISVFADLVCWSQWGEKDIDIHCSDGFVLQREGHQLWPSVEQDWLLFQENGKPMVYALQDS